VKSGTVDTQGRTVGARSSVSLPSGGRRTIPKKIAIGAALLFILRLVSAALAERIEHRRARARSRTIWQAPANRRLSDLSRNERAMRYLLKAIVFAACAIGFLALGSLVGVYFGDGISLPQAHSDALHTAK
jgi:hypothetical protein